MKKGSGVFRTIEETKTICDECGADVPFEHISYDARWSDGYDNYGDSWDFCSLSCLTKYLTKDLESSLYFPPENEGVALYLLPNDMKTILSKLED